MAGGSKSRAQKMAGLAVTLLALVAAGFLTILNGCSGGSSAVDNGGHHHPATPTPTAVPPAACSGQAILAIDPVANVAYVPIYTLDGSGNAQLAVVDLTVGATSPILKEISLVGSVQGLGATYNPNNKTILALGIDSSTNLKVYEIDTTTQAVTGSLAITGVTGEPSRGGIIEDFTVNKAYVAGYNQFAVLDTSVSPPTLDPTITSVSPSFYDSFSINIATGIMFISGDGTNAIVPLTTTPLVSENFSDAFATTDGNAFDPTTNILLLTNEVGADNSWVFNFATLDTTTPPATALNVAVPGLGTAPPLGEGPGGMAAINCTTHQGVVGDEFGQNFKLIHLPTAPITGAPDNNGQPGSGTTADANSAYTIAAALIPMGLVTGTETQLGMIGDPNSLAVDSGHNFMYAEADTDPNFHGWDPGSTTPLFLIRVDLSAPVLGASPTGGPDGHTFWTPTEEAIPLP